MEGIKGVASWVKDVAVSAWDGVAGAVSTAVGVVGDFVEKTGNWVVGNGFNSDVEVAENQARQRIEEAIKNGTALQEGSAEYNKVLAALYGNPEVKAGAGGTGEMSYAEYMQKFREMEEKNKSGYNEALNLMKKIADWSPWGSAASNSINPNDLNQDPGGALSQMLQKEPFNYNSTDADSFARTACMANATYFALAGSGANVGTPEQFFKKHIGKDIGSANARMNTSTYEIAKQYEKMQVKFTDYDKIASQDFEYGKATFERWSRSSGQYINHTVAIYKDNSGSVRIYADTGRGASGNNGKLYDDVIHKDRFKYFQHIKK